MAKFIVIDGLDGCGKATQTSILKDTLEKMGKRVVKISFPNYKSDSSAAVRMYLSGELVDDPSKINPYMCSSFYSVDRFIQYMVDWKKYFEEDDNTIIIADRYLSSNILLHCTKLNSNEEKEKFIKWCYEFECSLCGLPKEDITIVLTLKPETSQKLMSIRYNNNETQKDLHESNVEYLKKCHNTVSEVTKYINDNKIANWEILSCDSNENEVGIDTIENISKKVMKLVKNIINI